MMLTEQQKIAIQAAMDGHAWPGGYPTFLITADGDALCPGCVREELHQIIGACWENDAHGGWMPAAAEINWEDSALYCAHCGSRIESAYAEDEAA